jgi:hypothetical protein
VSGRKSAWLCTFLLTAAIAGGCGGSGQQSKTAGAATNPKKEGQTTLTEAAAHLDQHVRKAPASATIGSSKSAAAVASSSPSGTFKAPKPPVIAAGPLISRFSGGGSEAIGSLSEKTSVVLEWKTATPPLQIFNGHGFLLVNSNLPSGRVRVASGDYRGLHVGARGPWTITIHASA